ncbi:MAG TPA: response regulator, partial [Thermoanaerobaculia bacterium]|nr:response regulator [Thermoanaerobaculia bacterium]
MAKKILLADDSLTIQKVIELTFPSDRFEVVSFSNGKDALDKLDAVRPDIVLADVVMPSIDGYEVCRQVKARYPGTPVVLLTGTFEPFDEQKAQDAGADANVIKPFDSSALVQKVDELLASYGEAQPQPEVSGVPEEAPAEPAYEPPVVPPAPGQPSFSFEEPSPAPVPGEEPAEELFDTGAPSAPVQEEGPLSDTVPEAPVPGDVLAEEPLFDVPSEPAGASEAPFAEELIPQEAVSSAPLNEVPAEEPAYEAPAEETAEAPSWDAPVPETPAEEPAYEAPAEEAAEAPSWDAPVPEAPAEEPSYEAPAEEAAEAPSW